MLRLSPVRGAFGSHGVFGSLFGHSVTQNLPVLAQQAQISIWRRPAR